MDPIVLAFGKALVGAIATDTWPQARAAVTGLWRCVHPRQEDDDIGTDLDELREQVLVARRDGDTDTERALEGAWQVRLQQLLRADPALAAELQRVLDQVLTPTLTPAMSSMLFNVGGVTSAAGVANLLATLLTVSEDPATLLLEGLAGDELHIEVLGRTDRELTAAEHYRLEAGPITTGHYRTGLLRTKGGVVAAETSLVILSQRLPPTACTDLAETRTPVGKILAPLGLQRLDRLALCPTGCLDSAGGDVAVKSSALLVIGGVRIGIATESITEAFCQLVVRNGSSAAREPAESAAGRRGSARPPGAGRRSTRRVLVT
jgi:hypothetical protein